MARYDPTRKPTFAWQAVLILLPVILLAVVGFISLRQDLLLVQSEAAERAQALAGNLVSLIWGDLTAKGEGFNSRSFQVDSSGQLVFPPPFALVPDPQSFKRVSLNPAQRGLWLAAQQAEAQPADPEVAITAFRDLLKSDPPEGIAASSHFSLGLLLMKQGNSQGAASEFQQVVNRYRGAVGESGLPLGPLAQLKLLELANHQPQATGVLLNLVCSNAVEHPNPLSAEILKHAVELSTMAESREAARKWQQRWDEQESARTLYSAAREHFQALPGGLLTSASPADETLTSSAMTPESGSGPLSPALFPRRGEGGSAGAFLGSEDQSAPRSQEGRSQARVWFPEAFWFYPPAGWSNSAPLVADGFSGTISGEERWLAARGEGEATNWYVCRSESEIGSKLRALLEERKLLPDYFGVALEAAGRRVNRFAPDLRMWHRIQYMSKGAGQVARENLNQISTNLLASATGPGAGGPLTVRVYLTSPEALFERQAMRTFWFGSLIAAAAVAALAGLVAAYRAFSRQLRLSELKSNFVSSVSHELRAPIASVRLLAESLEGGKISEPARQHQYFGFIAQECRRLSALVENVLDFSRIEQGRKQYEFEPTDVVGLVEQTVRLMQTYAADKQVHLRLILPQPREQTAAWPAPELDGKAIQQALVNLIDNAVKHSPREGTVRVGLEEQSVENPTNTNGGALLPGTEERAAFSPAPPRKERVGRAGPFMSAVQGESQVGSAQPREVGTRQPASMISIWVEDDGEGIPAAEHAKIFERFYRCGSELRRETQGVGIGLSIVKHILEAHQGRVRVRSAPGQGSRFTIELPIWNGS